MDKEILELLDKLISKVTEKTISEPCKILIDNDGANTKLEVNGCRSSLLITLAGALNSILHELNCDEEEFEAIRKIVGVKAVDNG